MSLSFGPTAHLYRVLALIISFVLIGVVTPGCGFSLKSHSLGDFVEAIEVEADRSPQFRRELTRALEENGVETESTAQDAVFVSVTEHEFLKNSSLVVPRRGLIEYELTLRVEFTITIDEQEPELVVLSATRRVNVNADKLLSTSAEDRVVRSDLTKKVVKQLIRRLYLQFYQADEKN